MVKLLQLYIAAYKAVKVAEGKLKTLRARLEAAYPKGATALKVDSDGQLEWGPEKKRVAKPEAMPAEVRKACTESSVSLDKLDSWIKLNRARIEQMGWDPKTWWTEIPGFKLLSKVK